jgi:O-antigen/teichoic acid export membrane protein
MAATTSQHEGAHERAQRGTRQFLVARACIVLCGYAMTAILTRGLGPANYGIYGVVISQLLWLEVLLNGGVPGSTAKLMADGGHDQDAVERSARALLVGWSVLLLLACWMIAPWVATLVHIPDGATLLRLALLDLPFMAVFLSYDGALIGRRRFGILAVAQVAYALTKLGGAVVLIALGFSVERALIAYVVATAVACTLVMLRCRPRGFRPHPEIVGEILAITAPIAVYLVATQVLLNLALWSLNTLSADGAETLGQYVASMNLSRMLMVISGAQAGVVFASVAWAVAGRDTAGAQRHIQDATRFALIIAIGAWVILSVDAAAVLSLLYSSAYAEGRLFLPLQLAALALFTLLDVFAHALMAAGRQRFVAVAVLATIPFAWLANWLLIPLFGAIGAAASLVTGILVATLVLGASAYGRFGSLIRPATLVRVLVAAAAVGLVSAAVPVQGFWIVPKLALVGILYLLALHKMGEITTKDFELLKKRRDKSPA